MTAPAPSPELAKPPPGDTKRSRPWLMRMFILIATLGAGLYLAYLLYSSPEIPPVAPEALVGVEVAAIDKEPVTYHDADLARRLHLGLCQGRKLLLPVKAGYTCTFTFLGKDGTRLYSFDLMVDRHIRLKGKTVLVYVGKPTGDVLYDTYRKAFPKEGSVMRSLGKRREDTPE